MEEEEIVEEPMVPRFETPPKQVFTKQEGQKNLSTVKSPSGYGDVAEQVIIPYSPILEDYGSYSEAEISRERTTVIRVCMDNLISLSMGRPSEVEILQLAKSIASKYPCLRDKPEEPLRNNYVILQ